MTGAGKQWGGERPDTSMEWPPADPALLKAYEDAATVRAGKMVLLGHPQWWIDACPEYAREKFCRLDIVKRDICPNYLTQKVNRDTTPKLRELCASVAPEAAIYCLKLRKSCLDMVDIAEDAIKLGRFASAYDVLSEAMTYDGANGPCCAAFHPLTNDVLDGHRIDVMECYALADVAHIAYRIMHPVARAQRRWQYSHHEVEPEGDLRRVMCTYCRQPLDATQHRGGPSDYLVTRMTNKHTVVCALASLWNFGTTKEWK